MDILTLIILFTIIGSLFSLIGGIFLLSNKKFAKTTHFLSAFAAGALLGTAFFDLLPEAFEKQQSVELFSWVLIGIIGFFILERYIQWFHHHHDFEKSKNTSLVSLVIIGDSLHNLIDGIIIAATFLISIPLGIVTTFAVAAHEIPQEIGDFGILLSRGIKKTKIIFLNIFSALFAIVGALATFIIGGEIHNYLPVLLCLASGFFIYIALSDLMPEIHNEEKRRVATLETIILLIGIITIWIFVALLENLH